MQRLDREIGLLERQASIQSDLNLEAMLWEPQSCRAQLASLQRIREEGCMTSCQAKQWTCSSHRNYIPASEGKGTHCVTVSNTQGIKTLHQPTLHASDKPERSKNQKLSLQEWTMPHRKKEFKVLINSTADMQIQRDINYLFCWV